MGNESEQFHDLHVWPFSSLPGPSPYILPTVQAFRYAWRPDTKVFPYSKEPRPSYIDNGDNDGNIIDDIIGRTVLESRMSKCIGPWQMDGKCNKENNKEECDWDGGDCCQNSCKKNCEEITPDGKDNMDALMQKRRDQRKCQYECGIRGYDCQAI